MAAEQSKPQGPDLTQGVALDAIPDGGMVGGHVGEDAVLLARRGDEFFAIGATCTHYGGPLAEGLMVGDTVRCPWHHACFSLRTGEALRRAGLQPGAVLAGRAAATARYSYARSSPGDARPSGAVDCRRSVARAGARSSSWAAARPATPPPRCCAARALPAASR